MSLEISNYAATRTTPLQKTNNESLANNLQALVNASAQTYTKLEQDITQQNQNLSELKEQTDIFEILFNLIKEILMNCKQNYLSSQKSKNKS